MKIAVAGSSGRMGKMLIEAILNSSDCSLHAALDAPGCADIGHDAAAFLGRRSGVLISADVQASLPGSDVLIDFTRPEGTLAHLAVCQRLAVRAVIGTTGFTAAQQEVVVDHAKHVALVQAPNMSIGVNVMLGLLKQAAAALDADYDIEVIEAHHKHKVDAPSGTALAMGQVLAQARGVHLDTAGVFTRHGQTGERPPGSIGFATVRGGDIVGEHTVLFAGPGERIEISHKSSSRANYAQGSLRAARFLDGLGSAAVGLFSMQDVLGLAG